MQDNEGKGKKKVMYCIINQDYNENLKKERTNYVDILLSMIILLIIIIIIIRITRTNELLYL